jgi:hypothetical protein
MCIRDRPRTCSWALSSSWSSQERCPRSTGTPTFSLGTCAQAVPALDAARPDADRLLVYREQLRLDAMRALCQGTFRLGLLLQACGAMGGDSDGCDAERYEVRFGFWAGSVERPEPLSYEQYRAAADLAEVTLPRLAELAAESFGRAKQVCELAIASAGRLGMDVEGVQDFTSMARSAGGNALAATMLKRALDLTTTTEGDAATVGLKASYELKGGGGGRAHRAFPVVSLSRKKRLICH